MGDRVIQLILKVRKVLWNTFYKTKANFLEVNEKDFFLAVNPVIQQQQSIESDNRPTGIF